MSRHTFFALLVLGILIGAATSALAASPSRNGPIAYAWSKEVAEDDQLVRYSAGIDVVGPRGGASRTVAGCTETVAEAFPPSTSCTLESFGSPAFSPGASRIAFDHGVSIALVNADGTGDLRLLPPNREDDGEPAFSPTGERLVFSAGTSVSKPSGIQRAIWVRSVDGTMPPRQLSPRGSDPVWSRRNVIAFVRSGEIWVVRPSGRGLRQVTGGGGFAPTWSPDGTRIAFSRHGTIFVFDFRAQRLIRAARGAGAVGLACSPDGRRFAVNAYRRGLQTIDAHGNDLHELVAGDREERYSFGHRGIDWAPRR